MKYTAIFSKNNTKNIILFLTLLTFMGGLGVFTYYGIDNFYLSTTLLSVIFLIFIKLLNKIIIKVYSLIADKNNYFYLYISLRAIRLPFISLLYILALSFILKLIGTNIDHIKDYAELILKFTNYYVITVIGWTSFRVSQKIKEHRIQEFLKSNKLKDLDTNTVNRNRYKTTNIDTGFKLLNFLILALTIIAFINEATGGISGLLAVGGGLALVFGFSARDFLSNFFGGFMVYINRPFDIGDVIKITDKNIEGVVNEIGWTAVKIVTLEKRPLYIPNSAFSKQLIENSSKMASRPIKETFKFKQENISDIGKACKAIKIMLDDHKGVDQDSKIYVNINAINENYVEVILSCFAKSIEITGYYSIKQNILVKSFNILKEHNVEFQTTQQSLLINQKYD